MSGALRKLAFGRAKADLKKLADRALEGQWFSYLIAVQL